MLSMSVSSSSSAVTVTSLNNDQPRGPLAPLKARRSAPQDLATTFTSKPLLEAVMDGERRFPLTLDAFQEFLRVEHAPELGHFYLEAKTHIKLAQSVEKDRAVPAARTITDKYIRENAVEQINLGTLHRTEIVDKVDHAEADSLVDPELFQPALKEVKQLLVQGPFQRFLARAMNENINDHEVKIRYRKSVPFFLLALAVFAMFVVLQVKFPDTVLGNRWWRLFVYVPLVPAFIYSVSAACRVCTDLAYRHTKMTENDSYKEVSGWQSLAGREIMDDMVKKSLERLGTWVFWKAWLWAALYTAIAVALPPGYGTTANGVVV
jgi:hypothetical protein